MIWAALFYIAAIIADISTTTIGLSRGAREANPLIAKLQARFGEWWILWKAALSAPAVIWCYLNDTAWPMVALGGLLLAVSVRNVGVK